VPPPPCYYLSLSIMNEKASQVGPIDGLPTPVDHVQYAYPTDEETASICGTLQGGNGSRYSKVLRVIYTVLLLLVLCAVFLWSHGISVFGGNSKWLNSVSILRSKPSSHGCHHAKPEGYSVTRSRYDFPVNSKHNFFVSSARMFPFAVKLRLISDMQHRLHILDT
jgi:hypothetical protein